jgi:hypothetical protein
MNFGTYGRVSHVIFCETKGNPMSEQTTDNKPSLSGFFTEHPASVGEGYFEHMGFALRFSLRLFGASLAALVHAFLPPLFEKTASNIVASLHIRLTNRFNG